MSPLFDLMGQKNRIFRYFLQRYLGQFVEDKINVEQLDINLINGTGSITDIFLDIKALNELVEKNNLSIEFVNGYVEEIRVKLPFTSLLQEPSVVEVNGLYLTIQPKQRAENGETSESMWSSVASSIQLARDYLSEGFNADDDKHGHEIPPIKENVDIYAQAIDSIATRTQIKLTNTVLRIEHLPIEGKNGIALEVRIDKIEYHDETNDGVHNEGISMKKLYFDGVSFYTDEFVSKDRTFSKTLLESQSSGSNKSPTSPILIGKLTGIQEVKLKYKRLGNSFSDSKLDLDVTLGPLLIFSSPRQIYHLIEVINSLNAPYTQDSNNVKYKKSIGESLSPSDYGQIEEDLQKSLYLHKYGARSSNKKGWISNSVEESDDEYFSCGQKESSLHASVCSNTTDVSWTTYASSMLTSKSDAINSESSRTRKHKTVSSYADSSGKTIPFRLQLSNVVIVILHDDILNFDVRSFSLTPSSVFTMNTLSNQFFDQFEILGDDDFVASNDMFQRACELDHIRILGSTVTFEGQVGGSTSNSFFNVIFSAAGFEIIECLFGPNSQEPPELVELLKFMKRGEVTPVPPHYTVTSQPDITIKFNQSKKTKGSFVSTENNISISLQQCWSEIDLSIYDRLTNIITSQVLCHSGMAYKPLRKHLLISHESNIVTNGKTTFKISCPFLVVKFRFPIPDIRPDIEKGSQPWWKRSIRKDVLFINLVDTKFITELPSPKTVLDYSFQCRQISLLFQVANSDKAIPFLNSMPINPNDSNMTCEYPRILVKLRPKGDNEIEHIPKMEESVGLSCSFMETPIKEPSPFVSKRFVYKYGSSCEGEEIIVPADKEGIDEFINEAIQNAKIQVDVVLPLIQVDFSSKNVFEILYNRFNSDICLWQSSGSKMASTNLNLTQYEFDQLLPPAPGSHNQSYLQSSLALCKSGLLIEDSEDESEVEELTDNEKQSTLSIRIHVNRGFLSICPNLKDSAGNIIPDKYGQLHFRLEKTDFVVVSDYKGIPQENYICLQVKTLSVHHKAVISKLDKECSFNLHSGKHQNVTLKPIIYKSTSSLSSGNKSQAVQNNMLTVAISSTCDNKRNKKIKISCGIKEAALRYFVTPSEHSWFAQLKDFFDLVDYPVKGYDSPQTSTQLFLSLEDSLVDYRPLRLKTKCVAYFGNFYASCKLGERSKSTVLRFIAEESNLFISVKKSKSSDAVNLKKDYVSVVDLSMFEIAVKLNDNYGVEFSASSDIINIRICSDSASYLFELIQYFAKFGDLDITEKVDDTLISEPYLENSFDKVSDLSTNVSADVHEIMEDALKDIADNEELKLPPVKQNDDKKKVHYYFPDEGKHDTACDWATADFDSESDWSMMSDSPEIIKPSGNTPEIRRLSDRPIEIIDDHFNTSKKTNFLLPPKHFPTPVCSYKVSEINVVLFMFGGKDFDCNSTPKKKISFDFKEKSVEYQAKSNTSGCEKIELQDNMCSLIENQFNNKWFESGGPGRNHDVLMKLQLSKVRFSHEVYPNKTPQASRQVLIINSIKIEDKLTASGIKTFLHQYSTNSNPAQSSGNMLMIKAVHLRTDKREDVKETNLKVSVSSLRLYVDQDSLLFLYNFVCEIKRHQDELYKSSSTLISDDSDVMVSSTKTQQSQSPIFIKKFIFYPEMLIVIDYVGKHLSLVHGPLAGILMAISQLQYLRLKLKSLSYKQGLLGFEKLFCYAYTEWLEDIKKNQLPYMIVGVGPMYAFVQLCTGLRDLFWMPIEQYQKDGRIIRGVQRGADSFTKSTVTAALELATRLVSLIQIIAEIAYDMVSPGPGFRSRGSKTRRRRRYLHPTDIREGVTNACAVMKDGFEETALNFIRIASAEAEQKGTVGAVGGILRQIPPSIIAPIILTSAATTNVLGGVRNQLAPDSRREASLKWKSNEA